MGDTVQGGLEGGFVDEAGVHGGGQEQQELEGVALGGGLGEGVGQQWEGLWEELRGG